VDVEADGAPISPPSVVGLATGDDLGRRDFTCFGVGAWGGSVLVSADIEGLEDGIIVVGAGVKPFLDAEGLIEGRDVGLCVDVTEGSFD
jgi:hypothetical protein